MRLNKRIKIFSKFYHKKNGFALMIVKFHFFKASNQLHNFFKSTHKIHLIYFFYKKYLTQKSTHNFIL